MAATLIVEDLEGGVRRLTLSHPARRNALDDGLLAALQEALDPRGAEGVRALVIRGEGSAFCAGYDLNSLQQVKDGAPLPDAFLMETLAVLEACPWPTVAMVRGPAYGAGCDLALSCDFRLAATDAAFCLPPAKLGIAYAPEGIARAIRAVGTGPARRMLFTGEVVRAERALQLGLVESLHAPETLEDAALELCGTLAGKAPLALSGMKAAFGALARGALTPEQREHLEALRRSAYQSDDAREGRAAFLEKRRPHFTGH